MDENLICNQNSTLLDALDAINKNAKGVVFIVDDSDRLVNILTDGDARRALLAGGQLQDPINPFIEGKKFVYCKRSDPVKEILKKLGQKISILPVVDNDNKVVDYYEYHRDLKVPIAAPNLAGNEFKYLTDAFLSSWISSAGPYITQFENDFANYVGTIKGAACANGTVALHLALMALGVGPGDEVIVPDLTFAATINAVLYVGATPVLVDIDKDSWCIDPAQIAKHITNRTKAVIVVHLFGQACDMSAIDDLRKKHGFYIVEDCAQAHGAEYKGQRVGSFGDISCFSFFGNKIITTGEGGMCLTNNADWDASMRVLRDHGMNKTRRYWHDVVGYNYRMTNLQAAIGVAQLERISENLAHRSAIEQQYCASLANIKGLECQQFLPDRTKVVWLLAVLVPVDKRDDILAAIKEAGIDARPFFYPLSTMPIYQQYKTENSVSLDVSSRGINLPGYEFVDVADIVRQQL